MRLMQKYVLGGIVFNPTPLTAKAAFVTNNPNVLHSSNSNIM